MRGLLTALFVQLAAGSVITSKSSPLSAGTLHSVESMPLGNFASSTLDVKPLPGLGLFHSAFITAGSFNSTTAQCTVRITIEPTSSQVQCKIGLRGVDGNLLKNASFGMDDLGSVYSALETTLTVMGADSTYPKKLQGYMSEAEEADARRTAAHRPAGATEHSRPCF